MRNTAAMLVILMSFSLFSPIHISANEAPLHQDGDVGSSSRSVDEPLIEKELDTSNQESSNEEKLEGDTPTLENIDDEGAKEDIDTPPSEDSNGEETIGKNSSENNSEELEGKQDPIIDSNENDPKEDKENGEQIKAKEDRENEERMKVEKDDEGAESEEDKQINLFSSKSIIESKTSRLGHLKSAEVKIYKEIGNTSTAFKAGNTYINAVYYIKKQANLNGNLYYLISKNPSSTSGVVGWVKAGDLSTASHTVVDKKSKTFIVKGTGKAFGKAWGGSKDLVYNLSKYKGQQFNVHLTEKVGKDNWYRGTLNGKTVWVHPSYLSTKVDSSVEESKTSRLGHLRSADVKIYKEPGKASTSFKAGNTYTNAVYYIKKQVNLNGNLYYMISKNPSSTSGVVGWVKAGDLSTASHTVVDKKSKTFTINGTGSAYGKAWGGSKDLVYNLSKYKGQKFNVHLTEKVGKDNWYRGTLNGKTVWIHPNYLSTKVESTVKESKTSRLGHLRNANVKIYKEPGKTSSSFKAGNTYTHAVYYIKKQSKVSGTLYYLISKNPSSTSGVVGWVKAGDLSTASHTVVDKKSKTFTINGTGSAYGKAWGGSKDLVYNLSKYKGQKFNVHLTEKVGKDNWYRGTLNGKTVWIHPNYLTTIKEGKTSRLGHLKSANVKIYKELGKTSTAFKAGNTYTHAVYYIKKQAKLNGVLYYLISKNPSSTSGVVGWVKAGDLSTASHTVVDKKSKTFTINGTGSAYGKAWGGSKDLVYNLSKYKGQLFHVHLTEKVGKDNWYRGTLNGKTVWIHPNYLTTIKESKTSRLGHLKSANVKIYKEIGNNSSAFKAGNTYTNAVYYIKKQAKVSGTLYYLISKNPSSTNGVVGWVKSGDLSTASHTVVDKKNKTFYINGTGSAYSKAWGGKKDITFKDLSRYKDKAFKVHLTENVGNDSWYRGTLNGKTVWINNKYVNDAKTTKYNLTLDEALQIQMRANPQTDKYSNKPAYISSSYVKLIKGGVITGNGVNLRTSPRLLSNNKATSVNNGTGFVLLDNNVKGDSVSGSTNWYKIEYNGKQFYVHSSLAKINSKVGITTANVNIRSDKGTNSHIYDTVKKGTTLTILEEGANWHKISYNTWRSATAQDTLKYLDPTNFINDKQQKYQFLDLRYFTGVPVNQLGKLLDGKGVLDNKEEVFWRAAKNAGINEIYLISHALLETGNGKSELAKGIKYKGKTVYNLFGIGANDGCAKDCGAKKAYEEGWFTIDDAIIGGAKFAGLKYINAGQNTLYAMRWNPLSMDKNNVASHQYATDIGWATKQVRYYTQFYNLVNYDLRFDIPVYK
ncbi:GW dipeptide domain-containing protein [Oceanobacillus caeni]